MIKNATIKKARRDENLKKFTLYKKIRLEKYLHSQICVQYRKEKYGNKDNKENYLFIFCKCGKGNWKIVRYTDNFYRERLQESSERELKLNKIKYKIYRCMNVFV